MARRPLPGPAAPDDVPAPDAAVAVAPPVEDEAPEHGDDVLVTICKAPDGSYVVYSGDEPEEMEAGGAGMSEADVEAGDDAMPPAAPGAGDAEVEGQPCDTIGAALKAALDILQGDAESEGEPGSGEDQFQAGFGGGGGMAPTTEIPQKY